MLPNESDAICRIERDLRDELDNAKRLLRVGLNAPQHSAGNQVNELSRLTSQLQFVVCCRQFRSIIACAEFGDDLTIEILTRSMFEALVTMLFVLQPRVRLWKWQQVKGGSRKRVPVKSHGESLTPEFRAWLFRAHQEFQHHDWARRFSHIRGVKRAADSLRRRLGDQELKLCIDRIGVKWAEVLLRAGAYSGLKFGELATCLHRTTSRWYKTLYSTQSSIVHATRIDRAIRMDEHGNLTTSWQGSSDQLRVALHVGAAMYYACLVVMQEHFDFEVVGSQLPYFDAIYNKRNRRT